MTDILSLADTLQPNVALFKGDLQKIAKIHVSFFKFYVKFASKCDALVFDKRSQDYMESCIDYLENKKLSKKGIQQSRNTCLKMLESLNDLCVTLGCDQKMLAGLHKLIDQAVVDDEGKGGTLDLLQQLKNLLNATGDMNDNDNVDGNGNDGRTSPVSTSSSAPEEESVRSRGGVVPMAQYLLSDPGMDNYYHKYNKGVKNFAITTEMNQIMAKVKALRENSYNGLDKLLAKMKNNVPIWNYHVDRVDSIDSSNVMDNIEIFGGNKSVTDAVLYSCPHYLTVGPFDVYVRKEVFVYHCLVQNCNNCMTTSLEFLKLHVKFQHGDSDVDWNCTDCDLIKLHSICQKSLDGALDHLAKYHSVKSTYSLAKERLLLINQSIINEDSISICPQPMPENSPDDSSDLFHCSNGGCGYSTNSLSEAFGHFASIFDGTSVVQCRYCTLISYSAYELCEHLINCHGNANYKCGHCSYRSVSKTNCVYHQRDAHPESPNKILGFEPHPYATYKYSCRAQNTIKPFVCNDSCNFGTMIAQKFNQHILTHPGMTVTCHYCEKYHTDDMSDLIDHFLEHGVGDYHCLYCKAVFNFITKIEQHLHEQHPSQYPFIVLCQDYETRCHNLKGKYNKVQKLDLGDESIVVIALESDTAVNSVNVIVQSESILIQDVDHCKMQLKTFMKNKEEHEEMPYVPPLPHIEETLDLTMSEDPKERADIKPRLRVRTVEELISAQTPFAPPDLAQPDSAPPDLVQPDSAPPDLVPADERPEVATFYAFSEPTNAPNEQPEQLTPLLTPAQIKQERVCGLQDNEVIIEAEIEQSISEAVSNIQIKKEVFESARLPGQSPPKPQAKSPKKTCQKRTLNPVQVKKEVIESREMQVDPPSPQPLIIDENTEDQVAVAALISQEASVSDVVSGTPLRNVSDEPNATENYTVTAVIPSDTTQSLCGITNVRSLVPSTSPARPEALSVTSDGLSSNSIMESSSIVIGETVTDSFGQSMDVPVLDKASIENMPVEFDCFPGTENPDLDTKPFEVTSQGNVLVEPRYTDPQVVDTVIICSDVEDDFDEARSNSSTTSGSRPTTPSNPPCMLAGSSASPPTPSTSPLKRGNFKTVPTLARIFPAPQPLSTGANQNPPTLIWKQTGVHTILPSTSKVVQLKPVMTNQRVNVKKYKCTLCKFDSEDKLVTYNHLVQAHPDRIPKQIRDTQTPRKPQENSLVKAVSCPYCHDAVYEGIKSFERHHSQKHSDFTEIKCFLVYDSSCTHLNQIFACCFCGHFCPDENYVRLHMIDAHAARIAAMKKPVSYKLTVALKKMVCPLYNCLDEFLDSKAFAVHVNSHPQVIACKRCSYIADSEEEFQNFHMKIAPEKRLLHFYYTQSAEERKNLLNVQRFSHPLYSLSAVSFKHSVSASSSASIRPKTTARKSTGGAKYS